MPEEPIGDRFEFTWRQEAGRRSVILVHCVATLDYEMQCLGEHLGGLPRLALFTGNDARGALQPTRLRQCMGTREPFGAQAPVGDGYGGIERDLRVGKIAKLGGHWSLAESCLDGA